MSSAIGEIEKDEIKEKKKNRKEYLYAVAVLGVVGLLFAMATGVPIGAQVAVPALNSVAYFFDGGHGGNGLFVYYWQIKHETPVNALKDALIGTGIGWILDKLGINIITDAADILASMASMGGQLLAAQVIEAFELAGASAWIIWIITPIAVTIGAL